MVYVGTIDPGSTTTDSDRDNKVWERHGCPVVKEDTVPSLPSTATQDNNPVKTRPSVCRWHGSVAMESTVAWQSSALSPPIKSTIGPGTGGVPLYSVYLTYLTYH